MFSFKFGWVGNGLLYIQGEFILPGEQVILNPSGEFLLRKYDGLTENVQLSSGFSLVT